MNVRSVQYWL